MSADTKRYFLPARVSLPQRQDRAGFSGILSL